MLLNRWGTSRSTLFETMWKLDMPSEHLAPVESGKSDWRPGPSDFLD